MTHLRRLILAAFVALLVLASPVAAAKPDPGSISLISDGSPAYGEFVTFSVPTLPDRLNGNPFVYLQCDQDGELVAAGYHRVIDGVTSGDFGLYSPTWTGGAADCTASIADISSQRDRLFASVSFAVAP